MSTILKLIELANVIGPKFKEALPLIISLIKIFAPDVSEKLSYAKPAEISPEFSQWVEEAKAKGANEDQAVELARLLGCK